MPKEPSTQDFHKGINYLVWVQVFIGAIGGLGAFLIVLAAILTGRDAPSNVTTIILGIIALVFGVKGLETLAKKGTDDRP